MTRRRSPRSLRFLLAILAIVTPLRAQKSDDESKRINEALTVLDEIMAAADKAVPRSVMEKAEGIAVFPSLLKGGLGIGGQHGRGILSVRDKKNGGWSSSGVSHHQRRQHRRADRRAGDRSRARSSTTSAASSSW